MVMASDIALFVRQQLKAKANDNVFALAQYELSDIKEQMRRHINDGPMLRDVEEACRKLLNALLINTNEDHNTRDTAKRMAKMYIKEVFGGRYTEPPDMQSFPNAKHVDQLHTVGPIAVRSTCSHHFVPFFGKAWIGLLPDKEGQVLGLSKFSRLVDWIFCRPQIQEEATIQLANEIEKRIQPMGLAVVVRCAHMCMTVRGVKEHSTTYTTSEVRGVLRDNPTARQEFYSLIKGQEF